MKLRRDIVRTPFELQGYVCITPAVYWYSGTVLAKLDWPTMLTINFAGNGPQI